MNSADLLLATLRLGGAPSPDQLREAWPGADLHGLRRLVEFEGCALWTYRRLRQLDVLAALDADFTAWLSDQGRDAAARNLLVDAEAEAVARTLDRLGFPGVFMKGTARRLVADRYPLADARRTSDVDVLVPQHRAWDLWYELRRQGYERTKLTKPPRPEHHHLPALMNDRRVGVEIHTTHARGIDPGVSWLRHFTNGATVMRSGVTFRVPSATELVWTATAHALLIPDLAFFLVRLLDTALVWASGAAIDWDEVARRLDAKEIVDGGAAAAWLGAACVLAGQELPAALVGRVTSYDLSRELRLRFAVLRRVAVPAGWRKALAWWSSEVARR
ncbi:MAG TPA: nucleotidyltransferase family protein [Gemmatimonadales bacterium]|nr:nucleotidyltransferase family protein [Gemmatimonadales bacterium]